MLDLRLVQLKGGKAGVSGAEITRLKMASKAVVVNWLIAAFDGDSLHVVPEPEQVAGNAKAVAGKDNDKGRDRRASARRAWDTIRRKRAEASETTLMGTVVKAEPLQPK